MTSYPPPPPLAPPSIFQKKRFIIPATVVAVLVVLNVADLLKGDATKSPQTSAPTATATFVPRPRPSSPSPASTSPSPGASKASGSVPLPDVTSKAPEVRGTGTSFTMPDLTGSSLQSAQNAVQKLGVFFSKSHDLLGSRNQVLDRNWKVCDQKPAAGELVAGSRSSLEGKIDFGVVKKSEVCP